MRRGVLITFEGGEGSGKTTQIALLAAFLEGMGVRVRVTREPGGTELGERLRRLLLAPAEEGLALAPLAEALIFAASRAELVAEVIAPALAAGEVVLCDRFGDSTLAYQGYGLGLDLARLRALNRIAAQGVEPDLTLLLDLPPDEAVARVRERGGSDRITARDAGFHARVREGFLALARAHPDRFRVLDGRRAADELAAQVRAAVTGLLRRRGLLAAEEGAARRDG